MGAHIRREASGWVGALAGDAKGHASSLYLLLYYVGSSVTGSAGGWFWQHAGWVGVVALTVVLAGVGGALALTIDRGGSTKHSLQLRRETADGQ